MLCHCDPPSLLIDTYSLPNLGHSLISAVQDAPEPLMHLARGFCRWLLYVPLGYSATQLLTKKDASMHCLLTYLFVLVFAPLTTTCPTSPGIHKNLRFAHLLEY